MNAKCTKVHVYENIERIFANNLRYRDRKPKYRNKFSKIFIASDGKRWPLPPSPFPAPWPCCPPAIEMLPRHVLAGPLNSWPKNASCFHFSSPASRTPLPPQRWATTCCRLPIYPCTASLSCSLQQVLKLWLLSFEPSLLQFVLSACHCDSVSLLLNHGNPIFEPVCLFLPFTLLPLLFW